jgi:hypothetical protein
MKIASTLLALVTAAVCSAATTDLSYPPTASSGHDFNHSPVGQSFTAVASNVHGGIYLADDTSFTAWLEAFIPPMPDPIRRRCASITVRIDLMAGEGPGEPCFTDGEDAHGAVHGFCRRRLWRGR